MLCTIREWSSGLAQSHIKIGWSNAASIGNLTQPNRLG